MSPGQRHGLGGRVSGSPSPGRWECGSLLAGTAEGKLPAEIYVYALDKEGAVHGYMAQIVGLDLAKVGAGLRQSGIKLIGYLDLPPGEYRLRSLVCNGATGAATVHSLPLSVPAFPEGGPVLLPPFFPEPAGRWLTVSAAARAGQKERPYPFLAGDEPYVPAVHPVLVPGQESRLSLLVYNLEAGAVRVGAKVFGADGEQVSGGHIKLLEHKAGPPDRLLAAYQPPHARPLPAGGRVDRRRRRLPVELDGFQGWGSAYVIASAMASRNTAKLRDWVRSGSTKAPIVRAASTLSKPVL